MQQAIKCPQLRCQTCMKIANKKGNIFLLFLLSYSTFCFRQGIKQLYDSLKVALQILSFLRAQSIWRICYANEISRHMK